MQKLALGLVPALLLLALLLLSIQLGDAACEGCEPDPEDGVPAEGLTADPAATSGEAGPALVGRREEDAAPRDRHDVRVQLLDRRGRPVPGVLVFVDRNGKSVPGLERGRHEDLRTDERGEVLVAGTILDGNTIVHAVEDGPRLRTVLRAWAKPVALTRTYHVIRSELGLELQVSVVDAETGRIVSGARWGTGRMADATSEASRPVGTIVRMRAGQSGTVAFHVDAPKGYVAWAHPHAHAAVEAGTELLTTVYPLRREAPVALHLVGGDPDLALEEVSVFFDIGYRTQAVSGRPDAQGRMAIPGVPFFQNQPITVRVRADGLEALGHARLPSHPHERTRIVIDLDDLAEPVAEDEGEIGLGGGAGGAWGPAQHVAKGTLAIRAFLPDGRPAAKRPVRAQRVDRDRIAGPTQLEGVTDAEGRVTWTGVPAGTWTVAFEGPRFKTVRDIRVVGGSTAEAAMWEPHGGRVRVRVVDARGNGLPFAQIHVRSRGPNSPWRAPAANGTQRIDDYVDERGERVLDRVAPGASEISASYGSRTARAAIQVADRERMTYVIRIPDPRSP